MVINRVKDAFESLISGPKRHYDVRPCDRDEYCLDPLKVAISRLSDAEFDRMERDELKDVVRFTGLDRASDECEEHLNFIDDRGLRMLACLARVSCQRAIHNAYIEHGQSSPFIGCVLLK
jgi:hypothetical protein